MQISVTDRQVAYFRGFCAAILVLAAAAYAAFTIHWPWLWDTQAMHYVALLIHHGKVPYRDILDINMPGSYLTEMTAIRIFGGGDLGWRLYEFTLLGTITGATIVIAMPYDWLAGLFAGVMFTVLHGTEGPYNAAQRDEVMTALIVLGYALLFVAVRRLQPWLMLPMGFALGMAILTKPTVVPFAVALLVMPCWTLRRRGVSFTPYLLYASGGFAIAVALLLWLMLPGDSVGPFLFILRKLVPFYASLSHPTWGFMLRRSLPQTFLLYGPIAVVLAVANKRPATWEMWAVRLGFLFGAASYFAQRKGYTYHRYSYLCFALLWIGLEFTTAMRERGWRRSLGMVGMAFAVVLMVPFNLYKTHQRTYDNLFADGLERDLIRLGGTRGLQNDVQCLDMVSGCFTALYRLDLVQSTGFTGDTQLFAIDEGNAVPYYRRIFWDEIHAHPPKVIVLGNEWYIHDTYSFDKLNAWPEFRDYLNEAYTLDVSRDYGSVEGNEIAYRIYVQKNPAL